MSNRFGCYIGNIDSSVSLDMLKQVFSQCGSILDCSLNGRETDPYRFGFIDFANEGDRDRAIKFNGVTLAGRALKVGVSKGNVNRPNGETQAGAGAMPMGMGGMGGMQQHQYHSAPQQSGPDPATALLLQLVQTGAVNPQNLTPEQQSALAAALMAQSSGMQMQRPQMQQQMQQQQWGAPPMRGGYGGGRGAGGYRQPPSANPPPSDETMKLRAAQKKSFFDVIRKEADKYQSKLQEKMAKKAKRDGSGSDSESSSSSEDEPDRKTSRHDDTRNAL